MFNSEGAKKKFTLVCLGKLEVIGDVGITVQKTDARTGELKPQYYKVPFEVSGAGSYGNQKGTFLWTPEFLEPGYLPARDESASRRFVFSNNIYREEADYNLLASPISDIQRVGHATLPGLCGSEEKFAEVTDTLQGLFCSEPDIPTLAGKVQEVLESLVGTVVGYVMKQQFQKTDQVDSQGKSIYLALKYSEIAGFYYPTEKNIKFLQKKVEQFNGKAKAGGYRAQMNFDTDVPFDAQAATTD